MHQRLRSFYYATKGILLAAKQPNFRIQIFAAGVVVALGFWFSVTRTEWILLILCIGVVLAAEMFNSSIETLTDAVFPGQDKRAEQIKDLAAGAVWIVALASLVVGIIILGPKLIALF